jgi:predicted RNA-binding Zn ribbon-like protein
MPGRFTFLGGHVATDFTNTVAWTAAGLANERLDSFGDLVRWAREATLLTSAEAAALNRRAREQPARQAEALRDAREQRAVLHDLFSALADGRKPAAPTLRSFNALLRRAASTLQLVWENGALTLADGGAVSDSLELVTTRVAWAAAELVRSAQAARLKRCAGDNCGWLFVDTTKNGSRRWCSMDDCGSRAKARRYYRRRKASA